MSNVHDVSSNFSTTYKHMSNLAPYECNFQGDKYKDQEPDAFDLFKECHCSKKKKGYTPTVQSTIVRKLSHCAIRYAFFLVMSTDHEPYLLLL